MLSVSEIGQGLVDLCREGKFDQAMAAYYAEGIVGVEGDGSEVGIYTVEDGKIVHEVFLFAGM
jgi:hypothetical protein